ISEHVLLLNGIVFTPSTNIDRQLFNTVTAFEKNRMSKRRNKLINKMTTLNFANGVLIVVSQKTLDVCTHQSVCDLGCNETPARCGVVSSFGDRHDCLVLLRLI